MRTSKEARRDAHEYAVATMYYGEGAGTRRKLIKASVDAKAARDPHYARAFQTALVKEDMAEIASEARKERRRTDASSSVRRNTRAVLTGNHKGLNTSLMVLGSAAYYAHQTGLDVKLYEYGKDKVQKVKNHRLAKKFSRNLHSV